jgi:hypothetical protein
MRCSTRSLPVFFLAFACAALVEVYAVPSAEACTPPSLPNPGVAPAVTFAAPTAPLPKDAGIVWCIPHGSLDLVVSQADDQARVKSALSACTSAVYPEGTSKEDYTGESSGCSVSQAGTRGGGSLGVCGVGLAIAALRRRRTRVRHRP